MIQLDPATTALALIDLQNGIVGMPLAPRYGSDVLAVGKRLAERFRAAKAKVVLVRVDFAEDYADAPPAPVDQPMTRPPGGMPKEWSALAAGLAQPGDLHIVKRHWGAWGAWGAFHGTELDLQLRRRGITTVVLGGIATNFGVESTARHAWEHDYAVVIAEDARTSRSAELHTVAVEAIFPRIARVAQSGDLKFAGG
jgi:nicotinamidase-related amidase